MHCCLPSQLQAVVLVEATTLRGETASLIGGQPMLCSVGDDNDGDDGNGDGDGDGDCGDDNLSPPGSK